MTRRGARGRVPDERQQLAVELAALALPRVAPDEIVVFDDAVADYLADPGAALRRDGDTPLGSGIDVVMVTSSLLTVLSAVMPVLGTIAGQLASDVAKDVAKDSLVAGVRRLFRRPGEPPGPVALTREQAGHVREAVVRQCWALGLPSAQAALIADATIGSLHVRS